MIDVSALLPDMSETDFSNAHTEIMRDVVTEIHNKLRSYSDFSPLVMQYKPNVSVAEDIMRIACVRQLADDQIIYWNPDETHDEYTDYVITVVNRYKFEKLYLKLTGATKKAISEQLPNLVYYNPVTGKGFVNGNPIYLKPSKPKSKVKAKEIFDLLFAHAPNPVPRERLTATLRLGKNAPNESDRLSEAFSNLRSRCGVTSKVISLKSGVLNAAAMPFDKMPDFFIFPE
ncbi:MAG: hypothetical protein ACREGJ_05145 [Candidatus Saccharimonadales bacterium]